MARTVYMTEQDIQKYERMNEGELSSFFFTLGVQKGAEKFHSLLRSFRMAAQLANAGWVLVDDLKKGAIQPSTWERVTGALEAYAPAAFLPSAATSDYVCSLLEYIYNELSEAPSKEAMLELLYRHIEGHRERLPR